MRDLTSIKILLIEDNLAEARFLTEILKGAKFKEFSLIHAKRLKEALDYMSQNCFDVVLLDLTLPDSQGLASLPLLIGQSPNLPIVVLTNTNDDELAIEAVRQGAQDYLVKRLIDTDVLVRSLCYAIERKQVSAALRKINSILEERVEQQSVELIKAQQINDVRSEFVSMMSHDFRNPLTTILLSTQLLQHSDDKLTKDKKLRYFQRIQTAIKNMVGLLDEVLLINQTDGDSFKCQLISLNLPYFCSQLVEEMQMTNEQHQLVFNTFGDFGEGLWDENILRHIMVNLINNAIKYSPDGQVVLIELVRQENIVIIKVQDDGIGIPLEDQSKIFQGFYRGNNVGLIAGTGLGLAIVKKCVEAHGGKISFESEDGVGTTFIITLPFVHDS